MLVIIFGVVSLLAVIFVIINIFFPYYAISVTAIFLAITALTGWALILLSHLNSQRRKIFDEKILQLDRNDSKYQVLFQIYDFVKGYDENAMAAKEAMEKVYFFPKRIIKNPLKAKKKEIFSLLINYYQSLTHEKIKSGFIWDYNLNTFTWKFIGITSLVGSIGISILVICYHKVSGPNEVIYTILYFVFGAFLLPLISKFFGHFI